MNNQFFDFDEAEKLLEKVYKEYLNKPEENSKEVQLTKCPVCGSVDIKIKKERRGMGGAELYARAECNKCGLSTKEVLIWNESDIEEVYLLWNTRVPIDVSELTESINELKKFYKNRYNDRLDPYDKGSYEAYDDAIDTIEEWAVGEL